MTILSDHKAMQPDYALSWILPFVRKGLKCTSGLTYRIFFLQVWGELEKTQVVGVQRVPPHQANTGQVYQYDQAPDQLRKVTAEAFFYLFRNGFISPTSPDAYLNLNFHEFYVTQRGTKWLQGGEPIPEDFAGYMTFLREHVTNLDVVIEQYVKEALIAFERQANFAAAVMLGAASEKGIYLLAESMLNSFKTAKKTDCLRNLFVRRKLFELLDFIRTEIERASKAKVIPYSIHEGSSQYLMSLDEAIRAQRNDAVHPQNAMVSDLSVRMLFGVFPYALKKSEELRVWFTSNPQSI